MELYYNNAKMHKACTSERDMKRVWGQATAKVLRRRLGELENAPTLQDMGLLPSAHCHELVADRAGQLAVDLDQNHRLVFRPNHDPIPLKADGGLDWAAVTSVVILDVVDYH